MSQNFKVSCCGEYLKSVNRGIILPTVEIELKKNIVLLTPGTSLHANWKYGYLEKQQTEIRLN